MRLFVGDLFKMAFPQFAELWKLIDLLVRKDFRQANLVVSRQVSEYTIFPDSRHLTTLKFLNVKLKNNWAFAGVLPAAYHVAQSR